MSISSSSQSSSSSSKRSDGVLIYGVRRLRPGAKPLFEKDFGEWITKHSSQQDSTNTTTTNNRQQQLKVAVAFPDPLKGDLLLHILIWWITTTNDYNASSCREMLLELKSDAFVVNKEHYPDHQDEHMNNKDYLLTASQDNDDDDDNDGVFHFYGETNDNMNSEEETATTTTTKTVTTPIFTDDDDDQHQEGSCGNRMVLRTCHHATLAGYMRNNNNDDDDDDDMPPSSSSSSLPMIGVFCRAVLPGKQAALASSFQRVCDLWYANVPGILAALVASPAAAGESSSSNDDDNNDDETTTTTTTPPLLVHDIRIFANKASYDAHVDKSNPQLTQAMETWFANYDTSVPHTGVMVAEDTSDPSMRTSSIKDRPVVVGFHTFHYGTQNGCMGQCLEMDF